MASRLILIVMLTVTPCVAQQADYLSPVAIAADKQAQTLYIAQYTANRIAVFDIARSKVTKHIAGVPSPFAVTLSPNGQTLYALSATPSGTLHVIDIHTAEITDCIELGHTPVAMVGSPDGKRLYVCNKFSDSVSVVDLVDKESLAEIKVPRQPVSIAITPDGKTLFIANHLPAGPADAEYVAAVVSVIDTATNTLEKNIELPNGSTSLRGIAISPDGGSAYLVHILARNQIPVTMLERGWVNTNVMSIIDVKHRALVNTVLLDEPDLGVANSWAITCTPDGESILITHAGTHQLTSIDRARLHRRLLPLKSVKDYTGEIGSDSGPVFGTKDYTAANIPNDLTFMVGLQKRYRLAGNSPRGIAQIGAVIYTPEYFSDSIGIVDLNSDASVKTASIPLAEQKPLSQLRWGELLFNDAMMSHQRLHSCTSCHTSGARATALNWDLLNDGVGNPKNTKSLLLAHRTPPAMATGVRANAEVAVRSGIRYIQFNYLPERYPQAIDEYLKSLQPVPSPLLVDGKLSGAAKNGAKLFTRAGCVMCHPGPLYTDMKLHNVGTANFTDENAEFDTPTLVEVWRTAPYLHDGRAVSIEQVLTEFNPNDKHGRTSNLTEKEISDLAEFVLTR